MLLLCCLIQDIRGEAPLINVVYPKGCGRIGAVDSTFIFGSVTPGSELTINGFDVPVHKQGGFIAFLPIQPGLFDFILVAIKNNDTTYYIRSVAVPELKKSFGYDSLKIEDWQDSSHNIILAHGDLLRVDFQATPNCFAWFSIPDYADSVPMVEMPPKIQSYWGETVFGIGAVPESLKIAGYYSGFLEIREKALNDSIRIYYHLKAPCLHDLFKMPDDKINFVDALSLLIFDGESIIDSSGYYIKINPNCYPRVVEFVDSVQIMRVGPRKGYLSVFQPEGVRAMAVGRKGEWLKLRLSQSQFGWVNINSIKFLPTGWPPPVSYIRAIRTYSDNDKLVIEFPLSDRHPFRVIEEDQYTIKIFIYGVTSDTDWIRYDFKDKDIDIAAWSQPEPNKYCLKLKLKRPLWGYDTYYESNTLKLQINKPPKHTVNLKDMVIVVDPGHSPDAGAIGPTGLTESEVNLQIAFAVRKELRRRGAKVIMTREDMSDLPLYDRPAIAKKADADIFISIHNNALPDGVNPFENNGTSTYYYHPHSINLARAIHEEMLKKVKLKDHGLYYGNLAVNRPTQYPAVLLECAFMILPEQEAKLKSERFRMKIAKAVRLGLERFLKDYERK
jgi:N-acetylmuramoyl-L-alanine amidase